jgi:hypothetical protein
MLAIFSNVSVLMQSDLMQVVYISLSRYKTIRRPTPKMTSMKIRSVFLIITGSLPLLKYNK